jgi:hypothetical protein
MKESLQGVSLRNIEKRIDLLLIRQNFGLRKQLADQGKRIEATPSSLKVGDVVTTIVGTDLVGGNVGRAQDE